MSLCSVLGCFFVSFERAVIQKGHCESENSTCDHRVSDCDLKLVVYVSEERRIERRIVVVVNM